MLNRLCYPVSQRKAQSAKISEDCRKITLKNGAGQGNAYVVFDMGAETVGGYPVFTVKSYRGSPTIRISYSDRFRIMENEKDMRNGDFLRGTCKYLGVELPVLPANPGRFEEYSICRTGQYLFPLIQGQERFIAILLEGSGCEVELQDFHIYSTSVQTEDSVKFSCSDARLNKLWKVCSDTLRIATIRSSTWDAVDGHLLVRGLTQGINGGIQKKYTYLKDYSYSVLFSISKNPHVVSGICLYFRAKDRNNGYVAEWDLDGSLTVYLREDGINTYLLRTHTKPLTDNFYYRLTIICRGSDFCLDGNGEKLLEFHDERWPAGSFGICQGCEKWAIVKEMHMISGAEEFLCDRFINLDAFEIDEVPYFISDGAKRDRLPWSGDIDWAFRSGFYCHGMHTAMADTLRLFAKHQTPEGYVMATFYPEYTGGYRAREYGHYESDMFSGWYLVALGTYYRYTEDRTLIEELYPSMKKGLQYFLQYIEADGLFNQRYETSKGLWDHQLGDFGKNSYTNLIVLESFRSGALLAKALHYAADLAEYEKVIEQMQKGIRQYLWKESCGGFIQSIGREVYCDMANPFAMAKGLVTQEEADIIAKSALKHTHAYGKIVSLMIHGLYIYGYGELAYEMLTNPVPCLCPDGSVYANVDRMSMLESSDGPQCATECMHYPPPEFGAGYDWGDCSHPDSGVNDILCGDILGIRPIESGFKKFVIDPHSSGVSHAKGEIETPYGYISFSWKEDGGKIKGTLRCPKNCEFVASETIDLSVVK